MLGKQRTVSYPLISQLIKQNFVESNGVELSNRNYESN